LYKKLTKDENQTFLFKKNTSLIPKILFYLACLLFSFFLFFFQVEILAHPAIGGCLFHAGWGSIIESRGFGHPQILMPMVADQNLNAKLLVEKGIGLEVQMNKDGSFDRDAIAKSTRQVMVDTEGEALRLKAAQIQGVFANQDLHENYVNNLIQFMASYKKKEKDHQKPIERC